VGRDGFAEPKEKDRMMEPDSPSIQGFARPAACTAVLPRCVIGLAVLVLALALPHRAWSDSGRFHEARLVLQAGLSGMDSGIPQDLLDRADCVGVFPNVLKVAVLVGGQYGKGVISCRSAGQPWSSPSNFRIEGGNIGLQLGGSATDFVLLFIGPNSVNKLLRTKFTLGVDAAAAAGPSGRSASGKTDALFRAEIVSYSRSRGLFAGSSLDGATLRPAHKENRKLYGFEPEPKALFRGEVAVPQEAREFLTFLHEHSPQKRNEDSEVAKANPAAVHESAPLQTRP
jgi:lipid-binding SYLF domain-containing protein